MTRGEKIYQLRRRENLTQADLGDIIGWSDSRIGAYERGEIKHPRQESVLKIAAAFNMSYDEFMTNVEV